MFQYSIISSRLLLEENWRKHLLQELELTLLLMESLLLLMIIRVYIHTSVWHTEEFIIWEASWSIDDEIGEYWRWRWVIIRCGGSREHCRAAIGGDRMVVLTLVGCDHDCWILVRSLHSLLHVALLRRASIITPVHVNDV